MGRRENPVDPDVGPVQRLAHDLRVLRENGGRPTYRVMAGRTRYSASALAQAATGTRLPSLAVVLAYAQALGAGTEEWEERWRQADRAVRDSGAVEECAAPYRGLTRYEPDDRHLYFGRDELVGQLRDLLRENRFAAVVGPSGSGKSSLLRAGLVPALREATGAGRPAVIRVLTPGERPAHTHATALMPLDGEHHGGRDTWVVVDQFEELFTLCQDPGERERFLELLLAALRPENRLRAVVAIRSDFYGHCAGHRELADALSRADLLVGPMSAAELKEVVTGPASSAGLTVERALTARIIDEVTGRPGALPMVSHALLETWRRRRGRTLTLAAYEESGGVPGAIAATAEKLYGELSKAQARAVRRVLLRLVAPADHTADTRRPASHAEFAGGNEQGHRGDITVVVELLAAARLITLSDDTVELAHEALITGWPRLREWIEEDRERLCEQRRLGEAARTWEELGRDPGALYRGARLTRAEGFFAVAEGTGEHQEDDLTPAERVFLTTALAARDAERAAVVRSTKRFRTLRAALSVLLVLAVASGLLAWQQNRAGEEERAKAAARRVAVLAESLRSSDPRAAMLLAVAAWRIAPVTESRSALLGALVQPERDAFTDPESGRDVQRFLTGHGRTLISVTGRRVVLRDVISRRPVASLRLPEGTGISDVSPDARTLHLAGANAVGRFWDLSAGTAAARVHAPRDAVLLAFGPDGRNYLAVARRKPPQPLSVQLRQLSGDKVLFEAAVRGGLSGAALGPGSRLLALCSDGGALELWDTTRGERIPGPWDGASEDACGTGTGAGGIRFSADGARLAVVFGTTIRVWDIPGERLLAKLSSSGMSGFTGLDFTPDGSFLAAADREEVAVWRLNASDARQPRVQASGDRVFRRPTAGAQDLAWDPGRKGRVLRFLDGATVRSYDLTANLAPSWQSSPPDQAVLSPDGTVVAVAWRSDDGYRFALRSTRTGVVLAEPPPLPAGPKGRTSSPGVGPPFLTFSPDSRALAIVGATSAHGSPQQRLTIWDIRQHKVRASTDLPVRASHGLFAIALGADGRTLLASGSNDAGTDGAVEVWDTGSGRFRRTDTLPGFSSGAVAVRPDGRLLAGSQNQYAELPSGTVTDRALSEGEMVSVVTFSPDGTRLAVGDIDGRVTLWDGDVRSRKAVLPGFSSTATEGSSEAVTALAFSSDSRTLAVGGEQGTLQLWDAASQRLLGAELPTPGDEIRSLAFSRDDGTVHASGPHVAHHSYSIAPEDSVTRICARVGSAGLSPADWKALIADIPYRRTCG